MVCFTNYEITVPKDNLYNYAQYVLRDIYGFLLQDLDFIPNHDTLFADLYPDSPKRSWKLVDKVRETDTSYIVNIRISNYRTICRVLPSPLIHQVTIVSDARFQKVYEEILDRIDEETRPEDIYCEYADFEITANEIESCIYDLVRKKKLDRFVKLDNGSFLCATKGTPLIICEHGGVLSVRCTNNYVFDIDDGFFGPHTEYLNKHFKAWKDGKDLSRPIIPAFTI